MFEAKVGILSAPCNRRHNSKKLLNKSEQIKYGHLPQIISSLEFRHIQLNSVARLCQWELRFFLSFGSAILSSLFLVFRFELFQWQDGCNSSKHHILTQKYSKTLREHPFLVSPFKSKENIPRSTTPHFTSNSLARILSLVSRM